MAKPTHVNMYALLFDPEKAGEDADVCYFESVRFTPPLVISEEDLQQAIDVIGQALIDLDQVRGPFLLHVTDGS